MKTSPTNSYANIRRFIRAFLMNRVLPLPLEEAPLKQRMEMLESLLNFLKKEILAGQKAPPDPNIKNIFLELARGLEILHSNEALAKGDAAYEKALGDLESRVKLTRSDQKKWPFLKPHEKVIRILSAYPAACPFCGLAACPFRSPLEEKFRAFHALWHLRHAQDHLDAQRLVPAEQSLVNCQEELRHFIAAHLGIHLGALREEAETISQTTGRPERDVTLELFDRQLDASETYPAVERLFSRLPFLSDFIKPLPEEKWEARQIEGVRSAEEIAQILEAQTQDLTLTLAPETRLDSKMLLKRVLRLPEAGRQQYFRMPDIDRFRNVKILDADRWVRIAFDESARLAELAGEPPYEVAIIGGGPGGIGAAVNLACLGVFRSVVFERTEANSTIRDLWSREKEADTFYSGPPDPIEGVVGMEDTTRAVFLNRMQSFIDYFHLNLRCREPVTKIEREKELWVLTTPQGRYKAQNVIMTAGRYGKPRLLKWEEQIEDAELKQRIVRGVEVDEIRDATVLVIGGGNTAFDNVKSLTAQGTGKKGNKVYLSYYKKPFNVPGSLHVHNNDQLLQWEAEGKVTILWHTNTESMVPVTEQGRKRLKILFREAEQPPLIFDYIAPAVGWQIDKEMMEQVGVFFPEGGKGPDCDPETLQAFGRDPKGERVLIPGLYITGDYYLQRSVPAALTTSYRAAKAAVEKLKK